MRLVRILFFNSQVNIQVGSVLGRKNIPIQIVKVFSKAKLKPSPKRN